MIEPKINPRHEGEAAKVFAYSVVLLAKVEGMRAENLCREHQGQQMAYPEVSFRFAIEEFFEAIKECGEGKGCQQ